jgi:diguanylate cyclase (GGDEF)-like protein
VPSASTCGEAQAGYVVGSRKAPIPDLLGRDPGRARQTRVSIYRGRVPEQQGSASHRWPSVLDEGRARQPSPWHHGAYSRRQDRASRLADPLTGVANRRAFFQRGKRLLTRARFAREPTALILFDLDRFKSINDSYGHVAGDKVLVSFSQLAISHLRPNDLFGRIGGEEFASLVPKAGWHDALWLAERVRKAFEASFHTTGEFAFHSTVSVGVAISTDERSDLNALLSAADQALYRAKTLGRNRVEPSPHRAERSTTERAIAI